MSGLQRAKSISRKEYLNFDDRARLIQVDRRKGVIMLCLSLTVITIAFQAAALFLPSLITVVKGKGTESAEIPASIGFQSVCLNFTCNDIQTYCSAQTAFFRQGAGSEKDAAKITRDCWTINLAFIIEIGAVIINVLVVLGGLVTIIMVSKKTPKLISIRLLSFASFLAFASQIVGLAISLSLFGIGTTNFLLPKSTKDFYALGVATQLYISSLFTNLIAIFYLIALSRKSSTQLWTQVDYQSQGSEPLMVNNRH